ncbi:MAG: arsenic resistance N-acetyltransferase ArsN2 [Candidatus Humimicrobiia bacterium]
MKIKKAGRKDIPIIEKILSDNNLPYEDIYSKVNCFFIGYKKSKVVGITGVEIFKDYGLLRSLVVKKSFRGKGFGKTLCLKLIEYAKVNKVKELYLLTTTAKKFFKKIGFDEFERALVPSTIQNTTEFKYLCPSSATCMKMLIN